MLFIFLPHRCPVKTRMTGFTIAEVLITLAVLGVTISLGLPSFSIFLESNQLRSNTDDMYSSLFMARSEAVTRNTTVSLCKINLSSADSCNNSENWQSGWIAFVDLNADGVRDNGETILDTYTGMSANSSVSSTNFANFISFQPSGYTNSSGTINICVNSNSAQDIFINATGRSRIAEASCP